MENLNEIKKECILKKLNSNYGIGHYDCDSESVKKRFIRWSKKYKTEINPVEIVEEIKNNNSDSFWSMQDKNENFQSVVAQYIFEKFSA